MKYLIKLLVALVLTLTGLEVQALAITPSDCDDFGGTIACDTGYNTSASRINTYIETTYGVTSLYKSDVGSGDSKAFAGSYNTTFSGTATDPMNALIEYVGGQSITCPACYLLVKGGKHTPAWFLYDIGSWNGTDSVSLTDFWPQKGAISHVAIYGDSGKNTVPAPGPLVLLTIGLVGLGVRQWKKAG
jgi:hypothetical protein